MGESNCGRARYAASRCPAPGLRCGCIRDLDRDRRNYPTALQAPCAQWVDAGAAAATHLLELGFTPILQDEVWWALWCRGGRDRALAAHCYDLAGGGD